MSESDEQLTELRAMMVELDVEIRTLRRLNDFLTLGTAGMAGLYVIGFFADPRIVNLACAIFWGIAAVGWFLNGRRAAEKRSDA